MAAGSTEKKSQKLVHRGQGRAEYREKNHSGWSSEKVGGFAKFWLKVING